MWVDKNIFKRKDFVLTLLIILLLLVSVGLVITSALILTNIIYIAPTIIKEISSIDGNLGNIGSGVNQIKEHQDWSAKYITFAVLLLLSLAGFIGFGVIIYQWVEYWDLAPFGISNERVWVSIQDEGQINRLQDRIMFLESKLVELQQERLEFKNE